MLREIEFCNLAAINAPYFDAIERRWSEVLRKGRYIGGPTVKELEKELSIHTGTEYAVGTGNGLDALTLILKASIIEGSLKPGDHVLVPANTYIASILAVVHAGLHPVPVDIDPRTMVVTAQTIEQKITPQVKALMTVHLYGRAAWDNDIRTICHNNGLVVIEDNAQAIGARAEAPGLYSSSNVTGALGDAAAFSFYPTKNIGAIGDGGAVTTSMFGMARTVRALANYGSDKRFQNKWLGHNSRLDPLQAVAVSCKLPDMDNVNCRRRKNAALLSSLLQSHYLTPPPCREDDLSMVWHQYVVTLAPGVNRDDFMTHMSGHGVQTDIHYPVSAFLQPCFKGRYDSEVSRYAAADICRRIVSLPVNQTLGEDDMHHIAQAANSYKPTT